MEMSFLLVNGVPTKLLTLGKNVEEKPEKIVLIIPGKYSNNKIKPFSIFLKLH
jgi:hypothetical protein